MALRCAQNVDVSIAYARKKDVQILQFLRLEGLRSEMTYDPIGSTAKFTRAYEHFKAIQTIVETWSKITTYETVSEPDPERSGLVHCERYVARIAGPELPDVSALLGDCLHNFRCVLDHMIWFASVVNSGSPPPGPKRISFPVSDRRESYKDKGLHAVPPEIKEYVETLQPYHAGKDARSHPLWVVSELDNVDKHRQLHVIRHVALKPEVRFTSTSEGPWVETMEAGPVEDGTVLARLFTPFSFARNEVEMNLNITHGIVIEETETTPALHLGQTMEAVMLAVRDAAQGITTILAKFMQG